MAAIEISPLAEGMSFGSRVTGVDRAALADEKVRAQLNQLFAERGVIVFEGMEPTSKMQVELSLVFGPLKDHPVAVVDRADADNLLGVIELSTEAYPCIVEIDGKPIMLCNWNGTIFAVSNICSHAPEKLDCGLMRAGWIACPIHGARFDLATGKAKNPPAKLPIPTYQVRVVDDWIEVAA